MTKSWKEFCELLDNLDLFGKETEIYFNGKSKKASNIGKIYSFAFISVYIAFFLYSFVKMLKRDDLTYYEASANDGEILSIDLNKDLFYFGIGVLINNAAEISTNETIFKFQAKYYEIHDSDLVGMKVKDLEFEKCQIEKFG